MKFQALVLALAVLATQSANAQACLGDAPGAGWNTFEIRGGNFHDLSVNANGLLWAVGSNGVELIPQGTVCALSSLPSNLQNISGESVSLGAVAAAPDNSVWVVTNAQHIWHLPAPTVVSGNCTWSSGWAEFPGAAHDIAVASNGTVWVTGTNSVGGGWGIWFWNGSAWQSVQGGAVRIGTGTGGNFDNGQPWVVNSSNQIIRRNPDGSWTGWPGKAWDISVDASGLPVVVGTFHAQGSTAFAMYFYNSTLGWLSDPNIPNPFGGAKITSGMQQAAGRFPFCHVAFFIDDVGNIWELVA